jgi:hypothetical protein
MCSHENPVVVEQGEELCRSHEVSYFARPKSGVRIRCLDCGLETIVPAYKLKPSKNWMEKDAMIEALQDQDMADEDYERNCGK